jgi:integrase
VPKVVLTDAAVRRLKPAPERREIADGGKPGLYLVIQPSGAKSWAMRFRHMSGKSVKLTLGGFDETARAPVAEPKQGADLTLVEARLLAAKIDHERAGGTDVVAERKARKAAARRKAANDADNAYPRLLERYVDEHLKRTRRSLSAARMLGLAYPRDGSKPTALRDGLAERWATKPVRQITADDVRAVVREAVVKGAPGLGRRRKPGERAEGIGRALHMEIGGFLSWARREGLIEANPCAAVAKPGAGEPRERVLTDEEIVKVWHGSETLADPYMRMVKLLILTGCRVREVAGMRWSELSEDRNSACCGSSPASGRRTVKSIACRCRRRRARSSPPRRVSRVRITSSPSQARAPSTDIAASSGRSTWSRA